MPSARPRATGAQPRPSTPAALLVLAAVVCQQAGAALAVSVFPATGPLGLAALRLVFSAVVLLAVARPRLRGHSAAAWSAALGLGVSLAAMNSLIYGAIARLPLGTAITLEVLGPLILSVAVSRKVRSLLWAAMALAGVALLGRGAPAELDAAGVCFALGAAAAWAAFILCNAKAGAMFRRFDGLALGMAIGAAVSLPGALWTAGPALVQPGILALGLAVALLSSAVPYAMEMVALRRIPAAVFSVLTCISPAVAAVAGLVLLGQQLNWTQGAAIALVVAAAIGAVRGAAPQRKPAPRDVEATR